MELVELLRKLRAERRVKLEDVARAMNISREDYFAIEKGRLFPDQYHLDELAKFYGISPRIFDKYFIGIAMPKELGIPNEHLLKLLIDVSKESDTFKAILAQDINICISRVSAELKLKVQSTDADIEFYRSMLRLIRRVSESEQLEFGQSLESAKDDNPVIH